MSSATIRRCAAIARRTAADAPEAMLPCPACGAELKASNLDAHLGRVHSLVAGRDPGWTVITGSDRRMRYFVMILPVLALLGLWPVLQSDPTVDRIALGVWLVPFLLTWIPVVAAFTGKFRASVEVLTDRVLLRSAMGLLRRQVMYPLTIATGSLQERKESGLAKDGYGYRGPSELVRVGQYLELRGSDGRRIVLGAPKSTHPLKYWKAAHEAGQARQLWDIDLRPEQMVQLQYLLAEQGILEVRDRSTEAPREA